LAQQPECQAGLGIIEGAFEKIQIKTGIIKCDPEPRSEEQEAG
jgi:hypothetical protein